MMCDAAHDGHLCAVPGACSRALTAMLHRIDNRPRGERIESFPSERMTLTPAEYKARYR